jgi:tetratricopeptide (TPR) repeat protein
MLRGVAVIFSRTSKGSAGFFGIVLAIVVGCSPAVMAQKAGFVAPPRTIADITAILDQEKPDPAKRAKLEAEAAAEPPAGVDRSKLKDFYYKRGQARASLGRLTEAVADLAKAVEYAADYVSEGSRIELQEESHLRLSGDYREALAILERMAQRLNVTQPPNKGRAFAINSRMTSNLLNLGEIGKAEACVKRMVSLLSEARGWQSAPQYFSNFEASTESARGHVLMTRGHFRDAEAAFVKAEAQYRDALVKSRSWKILVSEAGFESAIDYMAVFAGRAKALQGRHAEAEIDIRRALLGRLKVVGKYHPTTANMLNFFSELLLEQSRIKESEALARASIEIYDAIGYRRDTSNYVFALGRLGAATFQLRRYDEAKEIFNSIDAATEAWPSNRRTGARTNWARIYAYYYTREVDRGIELARQALEASKAFKGENHYNTALTRAILATGLAERERHNSPASTCGLVHALTGDIAAESPTN